MRYYAKYPLVIYLVTGFTDVGPISSDASLEKSRTAIAGVNSVMFPGAAVAANFAWNIQNATFKKITNKKHFICFPALCKTLLQNIIMQKNIYKTTYNIDLFRYIHSGVYMQGSF